MSNLRRPSKTPILSPIDGTVFTVWQVGPFNHRVMVKGETSAALLSDLTTVEVKSNQEVKQGDVVGYIVRPIPNSR